MKLQFPDEGVGMVVAVVDGTDVTDGAPSIAGPATGVVEVPDGARVHVVVRSDPSPPGSPLAWLADAGLPAVGTHVRLGMPADEAALRALAELAPSGVSLSPAPGTGPEALSACRPVEVGLTGADAPWLEWVAGLVGLTSLELVEPAGPPDALGGLDASSLRSLVLRGAAITDGVLEAIRPTGLRELRIPGSSLTAPALACWVDGLDSLGVVELSGLALDDEVAAAVAARAPTHVYVSSDDLTTEGAERLAGIRSLVHLAIRGPEVSNAVLAALAGASELGRLTLAGPVTTPGVRALRGLRKLQHLDLTDGRFGNEAVEELAPLSLLSHLNVSGAPVGDAFVARLARLGLPLTNLVLQGTQVTEVGKRPLFVACPGVKIDGVSLSPKAVARLEARGA